MVIILTHYQGYSTIENLYPYANAKDIIADNYDPATYFTLTSCVIKRSVKEKAKSALESATDYCDFNVSVNFCVRKDILKPHMT